MKSKNVLGMLLAGSSKVKPTTAGRLQIAIDLMADRDPETGEPKEPILTPAAAFSLINRKPKPKKRVRVRKQK